MKRLPPGFANNVAGAWGERGRQWLDGLPRLLTDIVRRFDVRVGEPYALSYNYVARARRSDGAAVVVSAGLGIGPSTAALAHFAGVGAVRLLDADDALGAQLLERLEPGTALTSVAGDVERTAVAAGVMGRLWRPLPDDVTPFPTVATWGVGLAHLRSAARVAPDVFGPGATFDTSTLARAESLFADLVASEPERVLLHGDLHDDNILSAPDGWRAIDPKGVLGERAYECAPLLRDRGGGAPITARRVTQLAAALDLDPRRVLQWALVHAVLSAWWSYEDHGAGWQDALRMAAVLDSLL
jgi:streptomycin 6-kinase